MWTASDKSDTAAERAAVGATRPWSSIHLVLLAGLTFIGLWLRARGLDAEGFSDDEVHKWLAAERYLRGDFSGDDAEHPMLMKSLITLVALALRGLPMETITRLPNAVAGALTVLAVAQLGRRLYGRTAGLLAAALLALSTTAVGFHRIAKEDTLLGLFMVVALWLFAEARAHAGTARARRFELASAAALGAALASKYFVWYAFVPVAAYLWLRPVSAWRVPLRRWLVLGAVALGAFVALNWAVLLPSTWRYLAAYVNNDLGGDRGVSESTVFLGQFWGNLAVVGTHSPWWFYAALAAVKLAPTTAILASIGLVTALRRRSAGDRILLAWTAVFMGFALVAGAKYTRYFTSVLPVALLFAADTGARALAWLGRAADRPATAAFARLAAPALGATLALAEGTICVSVAPFHRLYVSSLFAHDATWFFPQDDYWDLGVREAVGWLAEHAEPGAAVANESMITVELYAAKARRPDLAAQPLVAGRACEGATPCYVLLQPGRRYLHNREAFAHLADLTPLQTIEVRGVPVVSIYRLEPGETPFDGSDSGAAYTLRRARDGE